MKKEEVPNNKCADCGSTHPLDEMIQIKDKYPQDPKYKLVCEDCFEEKDYEFLGQYKRP